MGLCITCRKDATTQGKRKCEQCVETARSIRLTYQKQWRRDNQHRNRSAKIKHRLKAKVDVIERYGGKCVCCGEARSAFLTIDHISDDGAEDRRQRKIMRTVWEALTSRPVDNERFRLLCFNCNCGRHQTPTKECPHVYDSKDAGQTNANSIYTGAEKATS